MTVQIEREEMMSEDVAGLFQPPRRHVLLSGPPRCGKTTIVRGVAQRLGGEHRGFYTEEVRRDRRRVGFRIITLDGRSADLARKGWDSPYRVGSYGVDLDSFEALALPLLEELRRCQTVGLLDEIGKMECHSSRFRELVRRLLDEGPPILATAPVGGTPFIRAVKARDDVRLIQIDPEDRDLWPERLAGAIEARE
ncbi:MAG: AAA family ATPase [Candidatus Eisenbacteria bacterium]|nr:AAA family ATPase [Candidatus Eisenbacteria bacterium]